MDVVIILNDPFLHYSYDMEELLTLVFHVLLQSYVQVWFLWDWKKGT